MCSLTFWLFLLLTFHFARTQPIFNGPPFGFNQGPPPQHRRGPPGISVEPEPRPFGLGQLVREVVSGVASDIQNNPGQASIGNIINSAISHVLPRVPLINIRDPLVGVNGELVKIINQFQYRFGQINDENRRQMQDVCNFINCNNQPEHVHVERKKVMSKVIEFERETHGKDTQNEVEMRFARTQQVKEAMLQKAKITGVQPINNGVLEKDILLTENQANFLLNDLGKGGSGSRNARSSIFFEENPIQHWDVFKPIHYTFDDSLEELDKKDVKDALQAISIKTCLLFRYQEKPSGAHLKYMKVDSASFCGLSYIGKTEPANPIYLSFQCANSKGVAIHETLHALGIIHQQLRIDRDKHVKIDWSNINPQQFDAFAISDTKLYSTYGIPYSYDSIMHYDPYTAAVNISKPTMIPLKNATVNFAKMGQRNDLSRSDVRLIKKIYCRTDCHDKNVYCGTWALHGFCKDAKHNVWMRQNCKASCDTC